MGLCIFKSPDTQINNEDKIKDGFNNPNQFNTNKQDDPLSTCLFE